MLNKKDYREYFNELYSIEIGMRKEVEGLLKILKDKESKAILTVIRKDEIRHAKIVKEMFELIK